MSARSGGMKERVVVSPGTVFQDVAMGTGLPNIITASSSASASTFGTPVAVDASLAVDAGLCNISIASDDGNLVTGQYIAIEITDDGTAVFRYSFVYHTIDNVNFSRDITISKPIKIASGSAVAVKMSDTVAAAVTYEIGVSFKGV